MQKKINYQGYTSKQTEYLFSQHLWKEFAIYAIQKSTKTNCN